MLNFIVEVDIAGPSTCTRRQLCGGNQLAMERTLEFGKELQTLSVTLRRQHGKNEANKKMLRVNLEFMIFSCFFHLFNCCCFFSYLSCYFILLFIHIFLSFLKDAFSLLAYADPWKSPVCEQLDPVQREPVCAALNSAIMESHHLPRRPPMELAIGHARELLRLMAQNGLGSCAFANIDHLLQP